MTTKLYWSLVFVLGTLLFVRFANTGLADEAAPHLSQQQIRQLITQLGHDEYLQRERAETQLINIGAAAFSALQAAERNADLEVSTRARYLLNQISIDWVRSSDSAAVRTIMLGYGKLAEPQKQEKIELLRKLPNQGGFGALARIVRYETSSEKIVRHAALAILRNGFLPEERLANAIALLRVEMQLDKASEAPASWIAVYIDQIQQPDKILDRWFPLIDAELELLSEEVNLTDQLLTSMLIRVPLLLSDKINDYQALVDSLERLIDLSTLKTGKPEREISRWMKWLIDREKWEALSLFEDRYALEIRENRTLLYRLALAREKQGRAEVAEEIAASAVLLTLSTVEERAACAAEIKDLGHYDWAEREWLAIVKETEPTEWQSLFARSSLSLYRLSDRLEYKAAADLLTESLDAVEANPDAVEEFQRLQQVDYFKSMRSNRDFYLASHYASLGDYEKERKYLGQAYQLAPENADIIIAMYHSKQADQDYRSRSRVVLKDAIRGLDTEINKAERNRKQNRNQDSDLATHLNHWAWLVSNTEGDFEKAVKYSKRSLTLQPGQPSFLDTLGRCHFAAGNFKEALKVQREAVEKQPHLMVMQRQLKLIEEALAKNKAVDN